MSTELDPGTQPEEATQGNPAPLWILLLLIGLGAIAAYSGYTALSKHQQHLRSEKARADLTSQRDRLKANATDLARQMEQANASRQEVENALKQSRADTEAAQAQITDLQKQVAELQNAARQKVDDAQGQLEGLKKKAADLELQTGVLEKARAAAEDALKAANAAKDALEADLKGQLAAAQKRLSQAQADLKKEREQVSPVPMPPPSQDAAPAAP
ncbi:hypothetical protein [Hyphomicrobium sp. D-2]|uniref:hypothetical protein n=1 Tax=Hyphomicrobium sp. D-2 TaxID=3041621 RepID=UPI002458F012|nr:hypothetical protein [Hyphomicrobium sp. D-2]MDH4980807.1 hypothetical protein [Hyphomicrobium sp. D-2]